MPDPVTAAVEANRNRLAEDLLAEYRRLHSSMGRFDEMFAADAGVRPHWTYAMGVFGSLGATELRRRSVEIRQILRENGVTYNVYADTQARRRPWALDVVPMLLDSQEWRTIERGLIQRAELFNLIGADLYGPQRLIRDRLLPPELIYSHPGFLRACHGALPDDGPHLTLYAADLVRGPDGMVRVLGDRTQAPSGAGYALENRIVMSRVLPSLYRDAQVHRVALFFRALRTSLATRLPASRGRTVVLTPGPANETYFEHAYLANYLDYTLVEAGDITVRDGGVWLKTVDGLQPVGVMLRRVDDGCCDPLELQAESVLGIPGLLQAVRNGRVAVANPLGSGVLENAGLPAFLPKLAKVLLGQELRLECVPTWWCGDPAARASVLDRLDRLVIKPTFADPATPAVFGARLSQAGRDRLAEQILARPYAFVGQEQVALSTAPVFTGERLEPRPMVLRSFLVRRDDGYVAMPGGLTRVAAQPDGLVVSGQAGGLSKDTWILASEPESRDSLVPAADRPVSVTHPAHELPSSLADNLFWLGRYVERTAGGARVFREVLQRVLDTEGPRYAAALSAFLSACTHRPVTSLRFIGRGGTRRLAVAEQELLATMLDAAQPGSLRFHLNALLRTGQATRDRLSQDAWRAVNRLDRELTEVHSLSGMVESLEGLIIGLAAINGLNTESLVRGHAFRFMEIGRRLERALYTLTLLRTSCELPRETEPVVWEMVLAMTDSLMTYRHRYASSIQAAVVLDLLLLDETNPRSVGYQLVQIQKQVTGLPHRSRPPHRGPEDRLALETLTALRVADLDRTSRPDWDPGTDETVSRTFADLSTRLLTLSTLLSRDYFSHVEAQRQLDGRLTHSPTPDTRRTADA